MQADPKTIPVTIDVPSAPPYQPNQTQQQEGKLAEWWNWITLHKHAPGTYDGSQQQSQYYQPVPQQPQYAPQYQQPPQQPQYQLPQPQYQPPQPQYQPPPVQYRPSYAQQPQQYQPPWPYQYQAGSAYYPGGSSVQQNQSQ